MLKILVSIFLLASLNLVADNTLFVGVGAGPLYGINESSLYERNPGFSIKANAVYTNLLGEYVSLEFSLAYARESQPESVPSTFESNMFMSDLRARFYFLSFLKWNVSPYVYGGLGALSYSSRYNSEDAPMPEVTKPDFDGNSISGGSFIYNFGGGISYTINKLWAVDISLGQNFTSTDNINPWLDDVNDAFWTSYLTVSYNLGDVFGFNKKAYEEAEEYESKVGDKLILEGVQFNFNSAELTKESEITLYRALKTLKNNKNWEVEIVGYTDDVGERQYNIDLSRDRAITVKNWLVSYGINPNRIGTLGLGPDNPILPNTSEENRARNRRIEFVRVK